MRWPAAAIAAAMVLSSSSEAVAQPRVLFPAPLVHVWTRLHYERKPGAEACLGETGFRIQVALGGDLFLPDPEGIDAGDVHVVVATSPEGFVARYTWTGSPDVSDPERRISVPGRTWRACLDALSLLATVLHVESSLLELKYGERFAPRPSEVPAPACAKTEPCPESPYAVWPANEPIWRPEDRPKPPERLPAAVRFNAAVWPELIVAGAVSFGFSAGFGVRYRFVSFGFEAHGDPPLGTKVLNPSALSFARLSGALRLCAHASWFAACATADAGRFLFPEHPQEMPASAFSGAAGALVGLEIPLAPPRLFLTSFLEVRAPIRPVSYELWGTTVFASSTPGVGVGLGALFETAR
jgi:hypothetical protein